MARLRLVTPAADEAQRVLAASGHFRHGVGLGVGLAELDAAPEVARDGSEQQRDQTTGQIRVQHRLVHRRALWPCGGRVELLGARLHLRA